MDVEYNTGAFTTGRDWWVVTRYSPDMSTLYYSDPANSRGIFDSIESAAPDMIAAAAGAIAALPAGLSGRGAVGAAVAAAAAAKATMEGLVNLEGTDGFKQHIFREEDEGAVAEIVINKDRSITFKSNSGNSDTVTSSKPTKK